jgi:hypothetical protein
MRRAWLVVVALPLAACGLVPDVGPPLGGVCNDTDTNPSVDVLFSRDIRPLINRAMGGCSCHLPTVAGPGIGTTSSGLDLGTMESLRVGGGISQERIVVPTEPCESVLFQKVSGAPPFGARMPYGGPYLNDDDIEKVHDWIAEGAEDN